MIAFGGQPMVFANFCYHNDAGAWGDTRPGDWRALARAFSKENDTLKRLSTAVDQYLVRGNK